MYINRIKLNHYLTCQPPKHKHHTKDTIMKLHRFGDSPATRQSIRSYAGHPKLALIILALIALCIPGNLSATLIKIDNTPIAYDPATDLYWYTNLSNLIGTYDQQIATITSLSISGYSNIHMANLDEAASLIMAIDSNNDLSLFSSTGGYSSSTYWFGRTSTIGFSDPNMGTIRQGLFLRSYLDNTSFNWRYVSDDKISVSSEDSWVSAWVVLSKDQETVPEPNTLVLLLFGLIAIVSAHKIKQVKTPNKGV